MQRKSNRIKSSWQLLCNCLTFLGNNKDLLFLPIISLVTNILLITLFVIGGFFSLMSDHLIQTGTIEQSHIAIALALTLICYFLLSFISLFCNSALVACAGARLQDRKLSVSGGLKQAAQHLSPILGWCFISTLFGIIINLLENSHSRIQKIIVGIIGFTWSICSYFVLPKLILENKGPITALKESAQTFKNNWRKVFGINIILSLLFLAVIGLCFALHTLFPLLNIPMEYLIVLIVTVIVPLITIGGTLGTILNTALFLCIMKNQTVPNFNNDVLNNTFIERRRRF